MASPETPVSPRFAHLHLHSMYSLLDGANPIERLIDRCVELGMDAVAVTDHGNLHGAIEFYNKAKAKGVKPILGIEAYVAPDIDGRASDRTSREHTGGHDGGFHLVLLAENLTGWRHLLKLSSDSFLNGFYYKPRMDKTTLERWGDGLIAINGHLGSSLAFHLRRFVEKGDPKHYQRALEEARWHQRVFKPNERGEPRFFIELQRHDTPEQEEINPHLMRLAGELGLPLVCDNDAHFTTADDWDAHDTLCCISMGKSKDDPQRLRYSRQLYVKSPAQMAELFADVPEALENTLRIAQRCNVELPTGHNHAPVVKIDYRGGPAGDGAAPLALPVDHEGALALVRAFTCPHPRGSTEWFKAFCAQFEVRPFDSEKDPESREDLKARCDGALRLLAEAGAIWRYGEAPLDEAKRARLERELQVLRDKHISAYFIIVWDFVNFGRSRDIPCNARGSGVGTMTGYVLGLSNACPVSYGLLFERFTDPDRSEYPDIDVDMCQDGRQDVIEYVRNKYGHVAQIITFGTLKARAAIRDVGRALKLELPVVDRLCKLVGDELGTTLADALEKNPDLRALYDERPLVKQVYDTALRLEGLARHAGVHAAGVIVATQPLDTIVPLYKATGQDQIVTQWDGPTCEKVGLLKMDFLGLRTLSIIERAKLLITRTLTPATVLETVNRSRRAQGLPPVASDPLDLERLAFDDQAVFDLFRRGETKSVFQFESDGMRNTLMQMKPDRIEDLIAANALFRPGPMDFIDSYCQRKHARVPIPSVHPIVDRLLAETYGIMVYQEQVMQVVNQLGGIPLRAAYSLIKAISKKKQKDIDQNRGRFIAGACEKGLNEQQAQELFATIDKFAGYGFNKSHSTGYAIVAYQTAYLKTYFPLQYMAAVLTYESVSTDKVVEYIDECRKVTKPDGVRGIEVRPPDINLSDVAFTVVHDRGQPRLASTGHIRFGLSAVKGVGDSAIRGVLEARSTRPFRSLLDFCERVPGDRVNKSTLEALIKCGAFDSVHGLDKRRALCESLESVLRQGQKKQRDDASGQGSLFGGFASPGSSPTDSAADLPLPSVEPWPAHESLRFEKEVLGFHLSDHPLRAHNALAARFANTDVAGVRQQPASREVCFLAVVTRIKRTVTREKQEPMAMLTLEDQSGTVEAVAFPRTYAMVKPLLEPDAVLFVKGKVDRKRQEPGVLIDDVFPLSQAAPRLTRAVRIILRESRRHETAPLNGELTDLRTLLRRANSDRGNSSGDRRSVPVEFEVRQGGKAVHLVASDLSVGVDADLPQRIATVLRDDDCCELLGPERLPAASVTEIEASAQLRLATSSPAGHDEACASIDRY